MSLRNFDSSVLTQRILDKTNASFFNRQLSFSNPACGTKPLFMKTNPQTGNTADSLVSNIVSGSATQYNTLYGLPKQADLGCNCS